MALWRSDRPLVLASQSGVRRAVLAAAGIPLEVAPADIDERGIAGRAGADDPGAIASLLAREKALAIAAGMPGRLVLGADQTLSLGNRIFNKPVDVAAAREQLKLLRGQTHALHAAIALARGGTVVFEHRAVALMTMRNFSDDFLEQYLAEAGAALTASVGAYQVEKVGIQLFERIEGDHFAIMGLPLLGLLQFLRQDGSLVG
jgi:nucleoside triphosphate pyrophosphatase